MLSSTSDLGAYLESLQMQAVVSAFDEVGRARITQLINKTNQFNLTTRRYSERDVEGFEKNPEAFTLQVRLKDRFGDNGMVSVVICVPDVEGCWRIDTWLMSCRVLKRGLEQAVLNVIMAAAKARGVRKVIGEYLESEKNGMVKDHYPRLGFAVLQDEGTRLTWEQSVETYVPTQVAIDVTGEAVVDSATATA